MSNVTCKSLEVTFLHQDGRKDNFLDQTHGFFEKEQTIDLFTLNREIKLPGSVIGFEINIVEKESSGFRGDRGTGKILIKRPFFNVYSGQVLDIAEIKERYGETSLLFKDSMKICLKKEIETFVLVNDNDNNINSSLGYKLIPIFSENVRVVPKHMLSDVLNEIATHVNLANFLRNVVADLNIIGRVK